MKWKTDKPLPKHGDWRKRRPFAWLPTKVEDHTVWLETYQITEQYIEYSLQHDIPGYWSVVSKELLYSQWC